MRRIALLIEYDGTSYGGWQRQNNADTVQAQIEKALHDLTGETIAVTGASRTDAGVHALGQVAHFDMETAIPGEKVCFALNTRLPADIRVVQSAQVDMDFHARFDAKGKRYRYYILNRAHHGALKRITHAHVPLPLDVPLMDQCAQSVLGRHNFRAFMAAGGTSKTFERTMRAASVTKNGDELCFMIEGDGFLYNMVRIMAGTLIEVGLHRLPPDVLLRAMEDRQRVTLGMTAPANGLVLEQVFYEKKVFLV